MIKIFDRKLDYACLAAFPSFLYFMLDDFWDNWLRPPKGVKPTIWAHILGEIMSNCLDIRIAARSMFASVVLWLYEKRNSEATGVYPTFKDVLSVIKSMNYPAPSHLARYQETLRNRLEILIAVFGDHICSHLRVNWKKYLETDWAISIYGIPTDLQNLFISVAVAKVFLYRVHNNMRNNELVDLFVFDEAASMFKQWYEEREGTYLLLDYLRQAREFGIGFLISTQTISSIANSVLSNTSTKMLVGSAGSGDDYNVFGSAVGLTPEQIKHLKTLKNPGNACICDPRYPNPFLLEVPRIA